MDIVVKGRNVEVPEHYRTHVAEKLARLERYDRKVISFDVELFHEPNRRQAKNCQRVEITGKGRGPVIRAEASAGDFYAALDVAVHKLENRLRRAHDRRRVHHGQHRPPSVSEATGVGQLAGNGRAGRRGRAAVLEAPAPAPTETAAPSVPEQRWDDGLEAVEPGRVVREKEHPAKPMTVDQALYEMELVGHDFYLFNDADKGCPSVVYRRKGFDYGVIRLV
ncbi:SSU ribosomal protein S30P /sigma 54 modulation protein [Streptoalloteichus tenebrarius]|uniref:Ribosome hibernation promoting factor n=1 Tax=Streptoalloteichus tenebrarius (strain ATCC 17920 / DSM 40477 / JCM 4838 / CBS 697.72 / NBRC 16177 / NCIMB 11028 / NRRL B-12390 / A12253. 1 / ISP 5477) TaxID=1933 RepID=A0ABT1HT37_STRSD|nr:ribosome-associated translation inhibitor RaiA [Streptoalloteichus tenebrarius]MCP2258688.1 SSU ribosomal protein S30P /sigma 54 modulation protein [Streptoalloteichus tenebrarius]BFF02833.1 ribosome-associated translation inhibitor RaiA [Streptoalloteichus tenebrarius]